MVSCAPGCSRLGESWTGFFDQSGFTYHICKGIETPGMPHRMAVVDCTLSVQRGRVSRDHSDSRLPVA